MPRFLIVEVSRGHSLPVFVIRTTTGTVLAQTASPEIEKLLAGRESAHFRASVEDGVVHLHEEVLLPREA